MYLYEDVSILNAPPVITLTGEEFSKKDGITPRQQVLQHYASIGTVVNSPFGEVVIDKKGVKNSLFHGMKRIKMASFAAIKAVLENGIVILPLDYYGVHNKKQKTGMIAAPIQIGNDKYICVVEVIDNLSLKRLYVHESFLTENLSGASGSNPVLQSNDTSSHSTKRDSIANILTNFIKSQNDEEKNTNKSENNITTENKQYNKKNMNKVIKRSDLKRLVENIINEMDNNDFQELQVAQNRLNAMNNGMSPQQVMQKYPMPQTAYQNNQQNQNQTSTQTAQGNTIPVSRKALQNAINNLQHWADFFEELLKFGGQQGY